MINARAEERAPDAFASTDHARPLPLVDGEGLPTEGRSPLAVAQTLQGQRVLVLVHGYNYTVADAIGLFRTVGQTVERHVPGAYDAVVGYTWPSAATPYDYFGAKRRVPEAGRRLCRWLDAFWAAGCTVDLAAHSLGARVGAAALEEGAVRPRNVFLLAAAAGTDLLPIISSQADDVYVFYNRNDEALGRWYRLFEWETPLGYAGPSPERAAAGHENVTAVDCTEAVPGHTEYRTSPAVVDVLVEVLGDPEDRTGPGETATGWEHASVPVASAVASAAEGSEAAPTKSG